MKKLLLLFVLALGVMLPTTVLAQHYEDVVHLKNGSVIRGVIIEQVPNESIKLETRDGNLFVYKMDEIQKLTKEVSNYRNYGTGTTNFRQSQFNKPQGYMGLVELSTGLGLGEWAADRLAITMINGYRFIPQFAVGVGTGVELFTDDYYGTEIGIPLFLHLRSDFIDYKVSPYVAFNGGYHLSLSGGYFGGLILEPTFGISFNTGQKNRMTAGISFMLNRVEYYDYYGYHGSAMGSALKLKIGLSF